MPFECPKCKQETNRLVIPLDGPLSGTCCVGPRQSKYNAQLNQTVESWTHVDKKGVEHKHKISGGKQFEIVNRVIAEDGKTVINKVTGKPSQY